MYDEHDFHENEQDLREENKGTCAPENREPERRDERMEFAEYNVITEPPKKKSSGGVKLVAAALACALIGGLAGGGAVYLTSRNQNSTTSAATLQSSEETSTEAVESDGSDDGSAATTETTESSDSQSSSSTPLVVSSGTNNTTELTPSEVYAQNVNAVVAINTETTTTNYFGQASSTAASGSGFIITADGYVVTNAHVIVEDDDTTGEDTVADSIKVVLTSGDTYDATVVGYDTDNDVALLKIEATGLPTVSIGDSDQLVVGEQVCAIGNPLGELTNTLTVGYVSALDREINTDGTPINMFQTDCAINPGNSGGPLFDMYGNVIGITTAKYSSSSSTTLEGLGFALPINDVMEIVNDLQQNGYVTGKPYLGITLTDLSVTTASYYNLPVGVYVNSVTSGSCAETAGLEAGDIITALGDTTVQTYTELSSAMRNFKAGDTTTITVYRDSDYKTLTVTFDEKVPDYVNSSSEETEPQETADTNSGYGYGSSGYGSYFGGSNFGSYFGYGSDSSEDSGSAA